MDLYKLQAALKRLNGIYWNKRIDKALQESDYPRGTPQESAFYRHVVALRNKRKRAELGQALLEVRTALGPNRKKVVRILTQIATSPIPAGQLCSTIVELRCFDVVTTKTYQAAIEFAVCFSHEQFLKDLERYLIDTRPAKTEPNGKPDDGGDKKPKRKSKAETTPQTEHSLPLPMVKWACIFGLSANKLRELRHNGKYHFRKLSARLWTLPKHELPTEYLEKYRQHASQTQVKAQ